MVKKTPPLLPLMLLITCSTMAASPVANQPRLCSQDKSSSAYGLCFDAQWSVDLIRSRFDQYAYFPTPDFSRTVNGYTLSGLLEMHLNYTDKHAAAHIGAVYFPKADEPDDNRAKRRQDDSPAALRLDEAYVLLMPFDWVPLAFKFGSSYTSFGNYALNIQAQWQDYPFLTTPTLLMSQSLTNNIALVYDDHLNSGFSTSLYASSSEDLLDDKGQMKAWGADLQYAMPKFDENRSQLVLGFAYVSHASGARFLPKDISSKPGIALNFNARFRALNFELSHVRLNSGKQVRPRAFDFVTRYFFDTDKRYIIWGWSKTTHSSALDLPASSWWIGAHQKYSDYLSLLASVKRQDDYIRESKHVADYLYGIRVVLDIF